MCFFEIIWGNEKLLFLIGLPYSGNIGIRWNDSGTSHSRLVHLI